MATTPDYAPQETAGTPVEVSTPPFPQDRKASFEATDAKSQKRTCNKLALSIVLISFGCVLLIVGILGLAWLPAYVDSGLRSLHLYCKDDDQDTLDKFAYPNNATYGGTAKYKDVYVFNISNPLEVRRGEKPVVYELGPYSFQEFDNNANGLSFSANGGIRSYKSYSTFELVPGQSCSGCKESDVISTYSAGYLTVMQSAGGEKAFAQGVLSALGAGDLAAAHKMVDSFMDYEAFEAFVLSFVLGTVNCLDTFVASNIATCVGDLQKAVGFLGNSSSVSIADLFPLLSRPAVQGDYPGMIVDRTLEQVAYGYDSWIVGMALGSKYATNMTIDPSTRTYAGCGGSAWRNVCSKSPSGEMNCEDNSLNPIQCKQFCGLCAASENVITKTETKRCPEFKQSLIDQGLQEAIADSIATGTCGYCTMENVQNGNFLPFCLAKLPGSLAVENFPRLSSEEQKEFIDSLPFISERTGCGGEEDLAGNYVQWNDRSVYAVWQSLEVNRQRPANVSEESGSVETVSSTIGAEYLNNPSPYQLAAFSSAGGVSQCMYSVEGMIETEDRSEDVEANEGVTCVLVDGGNGIFFPPAGSTLSGGFASKPSSDVFEVYVSQGMRSIPLENSERVVDVEGVQLFEFLPSRDTLTQTTYNKALGVGFPVDGVQNLAFANGILTYLSFPRFIFGAESLLDNVILYPSNSPNERYTAIDWKRGGENIEELVTVIDIEPASGTTMKAHKRLQASIAVNTIDNSATTTTQMDMPYFDQMQPSNLNNTVPFLITPMYWMDEHAQISSSDAGKFKTGKGLARAALPIGIVGIVLGSVILIVGTIQLKKYQMERRGKVEGKRATETPVTDRHVL